MHAVIEWLKHPVAGAPAWVWIVAFVVLPLVNEAVARMGSTRAQSILQAVARALVRVFGRVPLLGEVLRILADDKKPPKDPPVSGATVALVLGALGMAVAGSGCGDPMTVYYRTAGTTSVAVTGAYKSLAAYDRHLQEEIRAVARAGDPDGAEQQLGAWLAKYTKARQGIDIASSVAEGAVAAAPVIELAIDKKKQVAEWVAKLVAAAADVARILKEAGVF